MECNFSEAVWDRIVQDLLLHPALIPFQKGSISDWITTLSRAGSKEQQREGACIMFFFWWCIWKEQNQRIFEHKECSSVQVAEKIKDAVISYHRAFP
jgi:hypothetical protein